MESRKRLKEGERAYLGAVLNVEELGHLDGDALLMLTHDLSVDHAHIVEDARHVQLVLFLRHQIEMRR